MLLEFTKMHGLGNDFMVVDLISQRAFFDAMTIRRLADRHFGIGFDQLLIVEAPDFPNVDFKYRIFNADGSEVEQCGNGVRCFARFVYERQLTNKKRFKVQTSAGIVEPELGEKVGFVSTWAIQNFYPMRSLSLRKSLRRCMTSHWQMMSRSLLM